jgi:hypothetical protein
MRVVLLKETYKKHEGKLPYESSNNQCNSTLKILEANKDLENVTFSSIIECKQPEIIAHTTDAIKCYAERKEAINVQRGGIFNRANPYLNKHYKSLIDD